MHCGYSLQKVSLHTHSLAPDGNVGANILISIKNVIPRNKNFDSEEN